MDMFREDVAALLPHLRAFARSLTAGDRQLADDIVQDAIMNALRAQHQFTPGTNLKAWLFTILRNRFKSVIVRKHVTAEVGDDDLDQQHWVAPEQESRIEILAFKRAFKTLSRVHREVLVLAVVHGLPYERIAEICNCELGTVKSRSIGRAPPSSKCCSTRMSPSLSPRQLAANFLAGRGCLASRTIYAAAGRAQGRAAPSVL